MTLKAMVIVPAYNEVTSIGPTVKAILSQGPNLSNSGVDLELIVIDDGSIDGTGSAASNAGATHVVRHPSNRGLGAAVRSGLRAARNADADFVVKFDADLQHDPKDIPKLLEPLIHDMADVVYGERFGQIEYKMPFVRRWGNRIFTALMRGLTGWKITDSQPGIFSVNKEYLSVFRIPGDYNYTQQIILDAYHKHMRFCQIPVSFRKRSTGQSFVSFRYPFKVLPQIIMVLVGVAPLRVFGSIGVAFLSLGLLVAGYQIGAFLLADGPKPVVNVNLVMTLLLFGAQSLFFGLLAALINERVDR